MGGEMLTFVVQSERSGDCLLGLAPGGQSPFAALTAIELQRGCRRLGGLADGIEEFAGGGGGEEGLSGFFDAEELGRGTQQAQVFVG